MWPNDWQEFYLCVGGRPISGLVWLESSCGSVKKDDCSQYLLVGKSKRVGNSNLEHGLQYLVAQRLTPNS